MKQHQFEASGKDFRHTRGQHNDVKDRRCGSSKQCCPSLLGHLVGSALQSFTYGVEQPAADEQGDDGAKQKNLDDMRLARGQVVETIVRLQLLEDQLDLPARRVGLRNGLGIERIGVDVGQVEPILGALGESDRDEAQATANGASGPGVDTSLERHLDFDVEDILLQSTGHLLESLALEVNGVATPPTVNGHDAGIGVGGQAGDEIAAVSVNAIKELISKVAGGRRATTAPQPMAPSASYGGLSLVRPSP